MKNFIILFLLISSVFSQDCFDDDFTMQIGLNNLWTSGIQGCEDGIQFLEKNGYTCLTSLNVLNNPFWGSNPNETLANICGCTCEDQLENYCEDSSACNYGEIGDCQYVSIGACDCDGNLPDFGYDCDGNCLNDIDGDGICDEFDTCSYNEITVVVEGSDSDIGWSIAEIDGGGWATFSGGVGVYENLCIEDDCWNFNMYGSNDGWIDTYYSIINSLTNELIISGTLDDGNFCELDFQVGNSELCEEIIEGCTDYNACNYNCEANLDDFSCQYSELYYDCEGNCINDFDNDEICDEMELNSCEQFPDPGPCFAAIEVFYFNQNTQECQSTIWGGCNGVVPFWTLNDCLNQCGTFSQIHDYSIKKKLTKSFNILGQEDNLNGLVVNVYNDGTTELKYIER